ncbi:AraC family transcriptional regulator [Streptomyces albicerus]|uniref:AraC family transcriptional regulator n=1 Tax=Streptomyces albicerus TaxID=2569859 RepID=UPI00124B2263|nr:helix-turn-helix domain-containing protein [Streptomyces albicerus]
MVRYFSCPSGTWEFAVARPGPRVRRIAHAYRGFRVDAGQPGRWAGVPSGVATLLLGFDHERQLWFTTAADRGAGTPCTSMLKGLSTSPWITEHHGYTYGVEVLLAPWAAFTMLGIDLHQLSGGVVELSALAGDRPQHLAEALAALPDWPQRFALLDTALPWWLARGPAWSPRVEWAYGELARTGGRIPIRELAEGTGWRQRQLEYRFREQIGLTPKSLARVFRLRAALRRLTAGWTAARTATACGFSDQSHLSRELKAMTNLVPSRLRIGESHPLADAVAASERVDGTIRSVLLAA